MTDQTAPRASSLRLRATAGDFVRTSLGFLPVVLLLRLYERIVAGAAHALPPMSASFLMRSLESDIALTLWVAAALAIPVLAVAQLSPRAGRVMHRLCLVILAILGVALAQYFAVTLVPLGADLFGYSWHDIRETTMASRGVSLLSLLPLAFFAAAAWFIPWIALRLPMPRVAGLAFAAVTVMAAATPSVVTLSAGSFASDTDYYLADNKTSWFVRRSAGYLMSKWSTAPVDVTLSGYPLMHRAAYDDVLGPRMTLAAQKPNFVFVIVEGLGRDFTGPGAELGGFTPFLDSLADRSLSWDNFLSTSGRTFGILPSLLGSLPFGPSGFMELGARMPSHATLVSLLKAQGYATSYFTGTNGHYDNIDVFMEREGVDRFVDQSGFTPAYAKQPSTAGSESWGYPDDALFRRSLELIGTSSNAPRLDVYLTITTHEPFIPPRAAEYKATFERRLAGMKVSEAKLAAYRQYAGIFQTLLYTDDAIRGFLRDYAARPDYGRTIFIITGDHRLIPVPPSSRIARYHVPFIVYSPMLKAPQHIASVSSHLDVVPSLLALLQRGYGIAPPDSAAWLGTGLDTTAAFRDTHSLALMRTKNGLDEYLDGTQFLSGDQLFRLDAKFDVAELHDNSARNAVAAKLARFRAVNNFVTSGEHLAPATAGVAAYDPAAAAREDSAYRALGLDGKTPVQAFAAAQAAAARTQYDTVRLITRRLLRDAPSYHDARALLGRSYGWERKFSEATPILTDLVRRAPDYPDGYQALIDLDIWQGKGSEALASVTSALKRFPGNAGLLYSKARAFELLGRKKDALAALDDMRRIDPNNAEAVALRARLTRP